MDSIENLSKKELNHLIKTRIAAALSDLEFQPAPKSFEKSIKKAAKLIGSELRKGSRQQDDPPAENLANPTKKSEQASPKKAVNPAVKRKSIKKTAVKKSVKKKIGRTVAKKTAKKAAPKKTPVVISKEIPQPVNS